MASIGKIFRTSESTVVVLSNGHLKELRRGVQTERYRSDTPLVDPREWASREEWLAEIGNTETVKEYNREEYAKWKLTSSPGWTDDLTKVNELYKGHRATLFDTHVRGTWYLDNIRAFKVYDMEKMSPVYAMDADGILRPIYYSKQHETMATRYVDELVIGKSFSDLHINPVRFYVSVHGSLNPRSLSASV